MSDQNANQNAATAYEQLGAHTGVQALVDRFYDLMDLSPEYVELRAVHGPELQSARSKLFMFLSGWLGGPNIYIEAFGHPRLKARHMPFQIGVLERDQWLACMNQAMQECAVPESLRTRLNESFFGTADWMRNLQHR